MVEVNVTTKQVPVVQDVEVVTLSMDKETASVLMKVLANVGGAPAHTGRGKVQPIHDQLEAAGVQRADDRTVSGCIYFSN